MAVTTRGSSAMIGLRPPSRPPRPCSGQDGGGTFLDQAQLELRQARKDVKLQLARRRSRVDGAVLQGPEADTLSQQFLHQTNQVRHRAAEAVQPPHHQGAPRSGARRRTCRARGGYCEPLTPCQYRCRLHDTPPPTRRSVATAGPAHPISFPTEIFLPSYPCTTQPRY